MAIKIETKKNGYEAEGIQEMINIFEQVAESIFPDCTVRHFYYGDRLDMADLIIGDRQYAHFNITANRVSLNGYEVSTENYRKIGSMTFNDECYNGKLMELLSKIA